MRTIRRATPADSEAVFNLARDFHTSFRPESGAFEESFAHLIDQDDALLLVAEESEQPICHLLGFDHHAFFADGRISWVEEDGQTTSGELWCGISQDDPLGGAGTTCCPNFMPSRLLTVAAMV